jgi:YegS/Rv2252/BmrU family lipid kinase
MNISCIAILVNPKAGKGKALNMAFNVEQLLLSRNIQYKIFNKQWPDAFTGFSDIFLIGGDGTLNYFINKYPLIDIPLSLFKGGSGNDFAWKLYGNKTIDEYFGMALKNPPKGVDAGCCNGRYFINGMGIGFDGEVVKAMGSKKFLSAGHFSYLWIVLKNIFFYKEKNMELSYNGKVLREKLFMVSIANGSRYGGGFMVAPEAIIDDGLMDIVIIKKIFPLIRVFSLPKIEKGKHLKLSFVKSERTGHITIKTGDEIAAHLDGELIYGNWFDIQVLPRQFLFRY